jgi:L,D-transpeptidase catalytic domain
MPYSVFFTGTGDAIHGTDEEKYIGRAVSHGCVRLSRRHAAILWALIKNEKMSNTKVVVSGKAPEPSQIVAEQLLVPSGPDPTWWQDVWNDGPYPGENAPNSRWPFRPFRDEHGYRPARVPFDPVER